MATEHRVLSFVPYLQSPPTHTQTGSAPASTFPSSADLTAAPPQNPEAHETTDSLTDPYGPRRWNSQMVELSGRGRALNEFSVERLGERAGEREAHRGPRGVLINTTGQEHRGRFRGPGGTC